MTARSNFRRTRERVEGLLELNRQLSIRGRPLRAHSDVLRAAIVLSLGALDAAIADAIVEAVPEASRRGKLGQQVADWLVKDGKQILPILAHSNPHQEIAEFVRDKLAKTTFQRTAMIENNLHAILGVKDPWPSAAKRLGPPRVKADDLKKFLDEVSERRNQIVHKGDIKTGDRSPETITRDWVEQRLEYVWATGEAICDQISDAYGPKRGRPKKSG